MNRMLCIPVRFVRSRPRCEVAARSGDPASPARLVGRFCRACWLWGTSVLARLCGQILGG